MRMENNEDVHEDPFFLTKDTEQSGSGSGEHGVVSRTGETELMWRCSECGEMGDIDGLPDECPSCSASKSELYYCTED